MTEDIPTTVFKFTATITKEQLDRLHIRLFDVYEDIKGIVGWDGWSVKDLPQFRRGKLEDYYFAILDDAGSGDWVDSSERFTLSIHSYQKTGYSHIYIGTKNNDEAVDEMEEILFCHKAVVAVAEVWLDSERIEYQTVAPRI